MRLLDAGHGQMRQDHGGEILRLPVAELRFREIADNVVVFVYRQHAVRRKAFDRERAGDADLLVVLVGLVVEILVIRLGGDGSVDFALARDPRRPELFVQRGGLRRPVVWQVSWDFPFR